MKLIILIALFAVGVTSDKPEATSAPPQATHAPKVLSTSLKTNITSANRRDGVSYSTSVIHRDPNHPELEAASSINFRLNTDDQIEKSTPSAINYHHYSTQKPQYADYQNSNDYASQSASEEDPSEDSHGDVVYGQNVMSHPQGSHQEVHHTHAGQYAVAHTRQKVNDNQNVHPNHQPYYKPITYAQPVLTETKHKIEVLHPTPQYKFTTSNYKTLSTPRPRTTPQTHQAYQNYHSHHPQRQSRPVTYHPHHAVQQSQSSRHLPHAQAYTQSAPSKPEQSPKNAKAIASFPNPHHGQTQSFNVGYSVKFGNENNAGKKYTYKPPRHESDIITGSHKEEVSKPSHFNFRDDKNTFAYAASNPQQILSQANLSPNTQKQLAFLENIQTNKFVQKEPVQSNFPWKNLSPSVEIYKSKEITLPGSTKSSYDFDHARAIGKSEGFDYSNAIDYMQQIQLMRQKGLKADVPSHTIAYLPTQVQDTQQIQVQSQVQVQPQSPYMAIPDSGSNKVPSVPKLPIDTSLLRDPYLTVHKDTMQGAQGQQGSKLPIHFDTTLIHDMGQGYANIFNENYNPSPPSEPSAGASSFSDNLAQFNNLLAEQSQQHNAYHQLLASESPTQESRIIATQTDGNSNVMLVPTNKAPQDLEMSFGYPQNGLFNPNLQSFMNTQSTAASQSESNLYKPKPTEQKHPKHMKMYKVKEHLHDYAQPQQLKFKVLGKPGNTFMRHQYEKMRHERPRQQSKRLVREYTNIEMDLRPPPMAIPYKTANYIRIKQ